MFRFLFLFCPLLLSALVARAATCTEYASVDYPALPWSSSYQGACAAILAHVNAVWAGSGSTGSQKSCDSAQLQVTRAQQTYLFGLRSRTVADCQAQSCASQSGKDTTINWTMGYTRSSIDADKSLKFVSSPSFPPADGVICDPTSGCQMALVLDATAGWRSASPTSEGLYRVSVDYSAQHLGKSCTPSAADNAGASPSAEKPKCPGAVGEVNGVLGCYGTAANPTRNDVPSDKPAQTSSANPAAGEKPTSGPGSGNDGPGRTPTNGDGGPAGGPAGAAGGTGTKPDGTTPKPGEGKEQANCGAPGQPKCGIDETGTPTKYDGNGAALDGWKEGVDKNRATIEKSGTGVFESFNVFFSAPPIVGCEAIELPNDQTITRHCDVVDGTRSVMAYIWALSALWLCVGWIREAI